MTMSCTQSPPSRYVPARYLRRGTAAALTVLLFIISLGGPLHAQSVPVQRAADCQTDDAGALATSAGIAPGAAVAFFCNEGVPAITAANLGDEPVTVALTLAGDEHTLLLTAAEGRLFDHIETRAGCLPDPDGSLDPASCSLTQPFCLPLVTQPHSVRCTVAPGQFVGFSVAVAG